MYQFELQIPPSPEYIAIVRLVVSSLASARRAVADERVDDLKLAVSEACTNAIEAHASVGSSEPVTIRVTEGDERLEVEITDRGPGFLPDALPTHPPVTDPARLNFERGLGIPLIKTLVDAAEFLPSPEGTTVRITLYGGPSDGGDETSEILRAVLADDE
ncbi:ATP-binding protein [Acidiferrimicrobium sp. IK]|uniref:ATP-binding protein n=1 Tax=Acidiferrimicrobium sp. IK TaxID=2871700 RepID=UPI0021CB0C2A|nr:ATP-binding protein [Acidiferrimicrobium sp. IK]MCU4187425.1 ATP-binding protein [Acidiferrimicrobium sp. IK]